MDAEQVGREVRFAASLRRRDELLREMNARRRDDWAMTAEGYTSERGRTLHGAKHEAAIEAALSASMTRLEAGGIYTGRGV